MNNKDLRAVFVMGGSFIAYWIFCITIIAQSFVAP